MVDDDHIKPGAEHKGGHTKPLALCTVLHFDCVRGGLGVVVDVLSQDLCEAMFLCGLPALDTSYEECGSEERMRKF